MMLTKNDHDDPQDPGAGFIRFMTKDVNKRGDHKPQLDDGDRDEKRDIRREN
jgi:hypothetical protein